MITWSIRKKLLIIFPTLVIIPLFLASFLSYNYSIHSLEKHIGLGLQRQATQVMGQIDQMLSERLNDVEVWVAEPMFQDLSSTESQDRIQLFLSEAKKRYGFYSEILCVNSSGEIVADTRNRFKGTSVATEPWFKKMLEGNPGRAAMEDLALRPTFGGYSILIAAPIALGKASPAPEHPSAIGIVVAFYNWSEILSLVNTLPILENKEQSRFSYALLINRHGEILTQPYFEEKELVMTSNLVRDHLQAAALATQGKEGYLIEKGLYQDLNLVGFASSRGYQNFKGFSWSALVFQDARQAFIPVSELQRRIFTIVFLAVFLSLAVSFVVAQGIVRPLKVLTDVVIQISRKKDLSQRVHVSSKDELGQLANAFNQMISDLDKANQEKNLAEQIALQSQKMSAVGQLAAGVAHEINNPLGVILGFAQGVIKRIEAGSMLEMPLKSIEREALRCKQLVQNLLTFSRAGKTEKQDIDINEKIESSLSLVMAQTKVKNIQLVRELEPGIPKLFANGSQIQQIIVNLSNNAMDAMPNGGTLTVRTNKTKLENKDMIQIEIQDTGTGIPNDVQQKIFEPFFTTKEVGKGTGLGLSLVYEVVQKHDGQIRVESEVGKGTLFRIDLPTRAQLS